MKELSIIQSQVETVALLQETEAADIDFFLAGWAQCTNDQMRRDLIRSVRTQIANVAAGEAIDAYRRKTESI